MRKTEKFKLDDKEIEVKELTGLDMMALFDLFKKEKTSVFDRDTIMKNIDKILPLATDIPKDELLKLAPSEMEVIWEQFKGVNSVFFSKMDWILDKLQLNEFWVQIRLILANYFLEQFSVLADKGLQAAKDGVTVVSSKPPK